MASGLQSVDSIPDTASNIENARFAINDHVDEANIDLKVGA
ncbi:hypothetical protein BLSMQ_0731 [Brevibacterium aurantiacum]|uniref:Uncharacterized protein n=1 Tax=Brevibacterium aurantiacum TaxID=273384 RepID=A0A1D7W0B2_BREAU|nr:hypothetical protein BLSMQ_0731 [Brevibacterium aurantiacum]